MWWLRREAGEPLSVSMSGVRLGDRVLVAGGGDTALLAGVAVKSGLTGRAVVVDEAEGGAASAAAAAERDGALVEAIAAPWTMLPLDNESFDLVILRDVLAFLTPDRRVVTLHEMLRVLRPGGRCLVVESAPRGGLGGLLRGRTRDPYYVTSGGAPRALEAEGLRAVRTLAQRDGLLFVEGVKENR